jgi:hypothetical protein
MYSESKSPRGWTHAAGVYEYDDEGKCVRVLWSRHRSARAAEAAARRYRRKIARDGQQTGGAYAWSAWWGELDKGGYLVRSVCVE